MLCSMSENSYRELCDDNLTNTTNENFQHLFIKGHPNLLVQHVRPQQLAALRTLLMRCRWDGPPNADYLSNAKRLRAFELSFSFGLKGPFKHMRHLVLNYYRGDFEPIWQLLNLRYLSFNHWIDPRGLKKLPKGISNLANLEKLDITSCNLEVLPECLGKLINLRELRIEDCPLQAFPDSLCELRHLKRLIFINVDNFKLQGRPTEVPEAIGNLPSLHELYISAHINHLPHSFNEIYNYSRSIKLHHVVVDKNCGIGWLKNFENIKGALCFERLSNLVNFDGLPFVAMHNLEELVVCWSYNKLEIQQPTFCDCDNILYVSVEGTDTEPSDEISSSILDNLQSHPNLKRFVLNDYPGKMLPMWMGDPLECASLQTIIIKTCANLNSLHFGSLCSLRKFELCNCSLSSLHEDSLPSQLEKLDIDYNHNLVAMPLLPKLASLVELRISNCSKLKPFVVGSYYSANWLPPASCNVEIWNCPLLKDWCIGQGIAYRDLFR